MNITGTIKLIKDEQKVTDTFTKREFVVTTDEQYPQHILIELIQDKCDLIDPYKVGDNIKVHVNLRGREWVNPQGEVKYFNSIHGWRIERVSSDNASVPPVPPSEVFEPDNNIDDDYELPF